MTFKILDVTLVFSEPVFKALSISARLSGETLEDYIAEVVRRDILLQRDGGFEDWADFAKELLKNESWDWKNQTPENKIIPVERKQEIVS